MAVAAAPAEVGFSAEFVAVLFAFLFLWLAITVLDAVRPPVVNLAGAVPLVGGALRSAVDGAFNTVRGWLYGYLSSSLAAYSTLLGWLQTLWASLSQTVLDLATLTATATWRISEVIIPQQIGAVTSWTDGQIASARAYAASLNAGAESLARALADDAQAAAVALFQTAEADAAQLVANEHAAAAGLVAAAEQTAADLVAAERAFVVSEILGVEADIGAAFRQAQALTAAAEASLGRDIGTVQEQLSGALRREVDSLLKQIEADKAALSAALAGGLAAVVADVAAIRALRCIQRCAELGALGELIQVMTLAEIFALIEFILHQPDQFRSAWLADVQPLVTSTVGQIRAALGV